MSAKPLACKFCDLSVISMRSVCVSVGSLLLFVVQSYCIDCN